MAEQWQLEEPEWDGLRYIGAITCDDGWVADVDINGEYVRKVLAAPDMLAALKAARNYMGQWLRPGMRLYDQVDAAIAKAEGRDA